MGKLYEGRLQFFKVVIVGSHMILIDVCDHGGHWLQTQERSIALVGLSNQVSTKTQFCIGACAIEQTANNKGWRQISTAENFCYQASCSGLAVSTRNGDTMTVAHEFTKHFGPRYYWDS